MRQLVLAPTSPHSLVRPLEAAMKKIVLTTGVLLALTASIASAVGIDLNWDHCLDTNPAHRVADQGFICDDSSPGAGDANLQSWGLAASVRTGVTYSGVIAWGAIIDLQVAAPALDPW